MPAVLLHGGTVVAITTPGANKSEAEAALQKCSPEAECELRIGGETYLSVPLDSAPAQGSDDGFTLRSLRSLDAAAAPVQVVLRRRVLERRIDRVGGRDRPGSVLLPIHRSAAGRGGGPFARERQDRSSAGVSRRPSGAFAKFGN